LTENKTWHRNGGPEADARAVHGERVRWTELTQIVKCKFGKLRIMLSSSHSTCLYRRS